jgi:hypothetical protein
LLSPSVVARADVARTELSPRGGGEETERQGDGESETDRSSTTPMSKARVTVADAETHQIRKEGEHTW